MKGSMVGLISSGVFEERFYDSVRMCCETDE